MVQVPPKMDSGTVCVQSRNYFPSCSDLAKSGCGSMGSMANNELWAQVCCFYFEGEPILSGWTLGSLTELPHRGEEGNPCFYFSFQTARVELKNKLEPGGPSVNSCANVLVWCEGTEGLRLERPDLPYFSIVEKKKKNRKGKGSAKKEKTRPFGN